MVLMLPLLPVPVDGVQTHGALRSFRRGVGGARAVAAAQRSGRAGKPYRPHRTVLNGIFWILRSGAPWRDLPERYGPWTTVYDRFRRWRNTQVFQKMLNALEAQARRMERIDFEFAAADGSIVRAHKSAAGARKKGLRP